MLDNMDALAHIGNNVLSSYHYTQLAVKKAQINDAPVWSIWST